MPAPALGSQHLELSLGPESPLTASACSLPLDILQIPLTVEAGCSILGKTAWPRFPEVREHSCQHEADTVATGRTKWPAEDSPPQISSGKSTSLTRGNHVQGFLEPRVGSDPGDHLLWYLLWSDGQNRTGNEWGLHRLHKRILTEPMLCPPGCLFFLAQDTRGPGCVRQLMSGWVYSILQHQGIPSSFTPHPNFLRQALLRFPSYQLPKFSP